MSQQENSELHSSIKTMMDGMTGMVDFLQKSVIKGKHNMTPEEAKKFSEAFKESDIEKHMEKFKEVTKEFKKDLNID